ncbi:hypothetical protein ACIQXI_08330 [Lysinibacillus sp. NPDC097195]|uniref:hypothetical protein n=1 Tax=Lysinibacillus sp. NPDC097195 TaxID=3364141 RepID=UPI0038218E21
MIESQEKQQQLKLLKWLTIALFLKLILLNIFPYAFYLQQLLSYGALLKSLSYFDGKTLAKRLIVIALVLVMVPLVSADTLISYWLIIFTGVIDLLILLQFGQILLAMEQRNNLRATTIDFMKKYKWVVVVVMASWTFLMHLIYIEQMILLFIGALLLFFMNIAFIIHVRNVAKQIKSTMHFAIFTEK